MKCPNDKPAIGTPTSADYSIFRKNRTITSLRNEVESGLLSRANGRGGGGSSLNRKQVEQMLVNIKEAYAKTDKLDVNGGRRTE